MNIKNILVSQPAPATEKSPFSELSARHDLELVFRSFIGIEGVTVKEFRQQRVPILDHTAVIMTSRSVVDHFFRISEQNRTEVPDSMKYFCVSEAIAHYLQKYIVYRKRKIFFGNGTFPGLMEVIEKHKEEKYLVPLSDPHKPEIPIMLSKSGITHSKVILSRTAPADLTDIDPTKFDILALYSLADVASFKSNFPELEQNFKVAVFGEGTARAALEADMTVDIMSPTPQFPSMIMALDKYIACHNKGGDTTVFSLKSIPEPPAAPVVKKTRAKTSSDTKASSKK